MFLIYFMYIQMAYLFYSENLFIHMWLCISTLPYNDTTLITVCPHKHTLVVMGAINTIQYISTSFLFNIFKSHDNTWCFSYQL